MLEAGFLIGMLPPNTEEMCGMGIFPTVEGILKVPSGAPERPTLANSYFPTIDPKNVKDGLGETKCGRKEKAKIPKKNM